jgi:hypothetical protein
MARTAVIAGTATAVSNKVSQGQAAKAQQAADAQAYQDQQQQEAMAQQMAAQQAAAPPPPPAPAPAAGGISDEVVGQLKQLAELRDAGILTEEEFSAKKAKLLGL